VSVASSQGDSLMAWWVLAISLAANVVQLVDRLTGLLGKGWRWLRSRRRPTENALAIPRVTVRLVRQPWPNATSWHLGSRGEVPVMQLMGGFLVTNVTELDVLVPVVKLRRPTALGMVTVKAADSALHGQFRIPPRATTDLRFLLWVEPAVRHQGETFQGDIALIDQFGNEHWVKKVEFVYL
jgi:hypothetical protein